MFFRNFYDNLRFFKDNYNRLDENALRWLKPGVMQLFFSLPMLAIGYHFENVETCSIDDISEVLILLGFVMTIFALIHIILGLLTHYEEGTDEEKECFKFTTYAYSTAPIFGTYWFIVIGTGITQFVLQCWAWTVFLGSWPFDSMPSVDYNNKSSENFCEKTPFQAAFVFLAFDMSIGLIVLFSWFWKLFKWCGLCCCGCDNPNAYRFFNFIQCITCRDQSYVPIIE